MSAVVAPPAGDVAALPEASISLPAVPQSFESKKNAIYFFAPNSDYGFLSTFSPHSFKLNDSVWKTVEHYFQVRHVHFFGFGSVRTLLCQFSPV